MPLPEPVPVHAGFVAGATDSPADRALVLSGAGRLSIPIGKKLDERVYEHLNLRRGTLEFWLQPRWTSTLSGEPKIHRPIVGGAFPMELTFQSTLASPLSVRDLRRAFHTLVGIAWGEPVGYPIQRVFNQTPLVQGQWYHIAICWDTDPQRGWVSEIYRDGLGSNLDKNGERAAVGLRHWQETVRHYKPFVPKDTTSQAQVIQFLGAIDAAIDEIRISDTVRYPKPFEAIPRQRFEVDEHTLLLLHLDGDARAIAPRRNATVEAAIGR